MLRIVMPKQMITGLDEGDVGKYVLLCGEPERVPKIASMLKGAKEVRRVREYLVYEGKIGNERITVASTGIGGPSTAILIEELANLGAHTFLRIGTSGGIADGLEKGDLVISTGAIRADGTSRSYAWPGFPAAAHYQAVLSLIKAAKAKRAKFTVGTTFSIDGFYTENKVLGDDGDNISMSHSGFQLEGRDRRLADVKAMGAKNIEMENSTIFTVSSIFGLRAGAICIISDVVPWHPTEKIIDFEKNIAQCIAIGIEAMSYLIAWDKKKGKTGYWSP